MENSNDIRTTNDTIVYLCDLKDGEKFKVVGLILGRIYVYKQHIQAKTLVFQAENGNGEFKTSEISQFKLKVERV